MRHAPSAVAFVALAMFLEGCAIPRWVPWIGKRADATSARGVPPVSQAANQGPGAPTEIKGKALVADDSVADRIVAVVNNDAITLGELQENYADFKRQAPSQASMTEEELIKRFLTDLIDRRVELQEAEREKITVDDAELAEEMTELVKKTADGDQAAFEELVKKQGLTMDRVKKRLRDSIRVAKVVHRKVRLRISVTDQEIDRYLAENREKLETGLAYHARHILIAPAEGPSDAAWEAARIRADLIRSQLLDGADFPEMARQHSRDASARDGGDLGILKRGELTQDIETEILKLRPGEISRPYRSSLGYHIFRLEGKDSLEGDGLKRVRQQIQEILFRQKYQARLEEWLKEIRLRAVIEVRM